MTDGHWESFRRDCRARLDALLRTLQDTGRGRLMGDFFTSEENKQLQKRRGAAFLDLVPPRFVPSFKPCLIRTPD